MFKEILTKPENHDAGYFIYLVHAIAPEEYGGSLEDKLERRIDKILDSERLFSASLIGCIGEEQAKKRGLKPIKKLGTYSSLGVIVRPADNDLICVAMNEDLGSPTGAELESYAEMYNGCVMSPMDLLTSGNPASHNELIVKGHKLNQIEAVFYQPGKKRVGEYSSTRNDAESLAEKLTEKLGRNIPVVEVPWI